MHISITLAFLSSLISKSLAHNIIVYFGRIVTTCKFTSDNDFACPRSMLYKNIAWTELSVENCSCVRALISLIMFFFSNQKMFL